MDKSLFVFILVGVGFFYVVMNIVKETDTAVESNTNYPKEQYVQYYKVDDIGQDIIDVTGIPVATQIKAWNESSLKEELLEIFPDFDTMKGFVKNRVRGEALQKKLLDKINEVEDKFFSGTINAEQAKRMLGQL